MSAPIGKGKNLERIQILRAVAAIAVVVHHTIFNLERSAGVRSCLNSLGQFQQLGAAGVDLFFVISGFIMLHISRDRFGTPGAVREFLVRRVIRIYPIYWLVSFAILALAATPWLFRHLQLSRSYVIASLFLLPWAKPGVPGSIHPMLDQGWTLSYELMFYVIFSAFLWRGTKTQALLGLPIVFSALFFVGQVLSPGSTAATFLSSSLTLEFCFGVGLAYLQIRNPSLAAGGTWSLWLGAILFASSAALPEFPSAWRPLVWGIPSALLVNWASAASTGSSLGKQLLVRIGDASYSLYLTHAFVVFAFCRLAAHGPSIPLSGLAWEIGAVIVSVVCGVLTYRLIERPLQLRATSIITRWLQ